MNYLDRIAETIQRLTDEPLMVETRALYRIYAVLCLAKGEATTDEDTHNAWVAWRAEAMPGHSCLVPFCRLSPESQALDTAYTKAIRSVAATLRRQGGLG